MRLTLTLNQKVLSFNIFSVYFSYYNFLGDLCTNWREHDSLPEKCKMRAVEQPNGNTFFQFLAPDETVLHSKKELKLHLRKPASPAKYKTREVSNKYKHLKKKMPKRKKLVSNQVIVTKATSISRKQFLSDNKRFCKSLRVKNFHVEPVVLIPKLKDIIADFDFDSGDYQRTSVDVEDISEDLFSQNNMKDILKELRDRQHDYESKLSSSEDEDEPEDYHLMTAGRTLRKRNTRLIYEEPPLEDELDKKFFRDLRQAKSSSVERITEKEPEITENIKEVDEPTKEEEKEVIEEEEEEDYMSDSWETELFSLKTNPRDKMRFQDEDNEILNEWFATNPYPDKQEQNDLCKILMVPNKSIKHWFQSKRVKCKEGGVVLKKEVKKKKDEITEESKTKEKLSYCKDCKQSFSDKVHLKLHCKRFHKKKLKRIKQKKDSSTKIKENQVTNNFKRETRSNIKELKKQPEPEKINLEMKEIEEYIESKISFNYDQLKELKILFNKSNSPKEEDVENLAKKLSLKVASLKGWFASEKLKQEIEEEVKERLMNSPSILKYLGKSHHIDRDKWNSQRNKHCHSKRTTLNYYQKTYLKFFFMHKQFLDSDDINELSMELLLSSNLLLNFFEDARDRKNITHSISSTPVRGKVRGRPKRFTLDQSKIYFDSDDEDLFEIDDVDKQAQSLPIVFASKSRGNLRQNSSIGVDWTEYQKAFLQKFYEKIQDPNDDDIDFLVHHMKAGRQEVIEWFNEKKRAEEYEKKESVLNSRQLLSDLINAISESKNFSFQMPIELFCKYCGDKFYNKTELEEHESIEAEEFEPEKFETTYELGSIESPEEESTRLDDFNISSDEEDEDACNYASSYCDDSMDLSFNMFRKKAMKKEKNSKASNAFMLWFKDEKPKLKEDLSRSNEMYKLASKKWKILPDHVRKQYMDQVDSSSRLYDSESSTRQSLSTEPNNKFEWDDETKIKSISTYKGYLCKECNLCFSIKPNLIKHLKFLHPQLPTEPIKQYVLEVGMAAGHCSTHYLKCDDCSSEFGTRSEMSRHLFLHYQESYGVADSMETYSNGCNSSYYIPQESSSSLFYDEEPVSYEAFRQYFDSEDVDKSNSADPQNFYEVEKFKPKKKKVISNESTPKTKVRTKIRFTPEQRGILMKSFHQSLKMTKYDYKSLYEELAETLELPANTIKVWFQNAKSARKKGNPVYL